MTPSYPTLSMYHLPSTRWTRISHAQPELHGALEAVDRELPHELETLTRGAPVVVNWRGGVFVPDELLPARGGGVLRSR